MTAAEGTRREHLVAELVGLLGRAAGPQEIAGYLFAAGWCHRPDGQYEERPGDVDEVQPNQYSRTWLPLAFLINSFRYALGRMTYMPSWVAEELIAHAEVLERWQREQVVRDIDAAIATGRAGAQCDVAMWAELRSLFAEMDRRPGGGLRDG